MTVQLLSVALHPCELLDAKRAEGLVGWLSRPGTLRKGYWEGFGLTVLEKLPGAPCFAMLRLGCCQCGRVLSSDILRLGARDSCCGALNVLNPWPRKQHNIAQERLGFEVQIGSSADKFIELHKIEEH